MARLKRHCKRCDQKFTPLTKYNKICPSCNKRGGKRQIVCPHCKQKLDF